MTMPPVNDGEWSLERHFWNFRRNVKHFLMRYGLAKTEVALLALLLLIGLIYWAKTGFIVPTL